MFIMPTADLGNIGSWVSSVREIRVYFIAHENKYGELKAVFRTNTIKKGVYRYSVSIITTFAIHSLENETSDEFCERIKQEYQSSNAINGLTAFYEWDRVCKAPFDGQKTSYYECCTDNVFRLETMGYLLINKALDNESLSKFDRYELLTVRKKFNDWKHESRKEDLLCQ